MIESYKDREKIVDAVLVSGQDTIDAWNRHFSYITDLETNNERMLDLFGRMSSIECGKAAGGGPYWAINLWDPSTRIAGYPSVETLLEATFQALDTWREEFMSEYCIPCTERVGHTRPICETPCDECLDAMKEGSMR